MNTAIDVHHRIGIVVALAIAGVSAYLYDHRGRRYADGKAAALPSSPSFGLVYRYLQVSTLVGTVLAFAYPLPWLLIVHHSLSLFYGGMALAVVGAAFFAVAKLDLGESYSPCFDAFAPRDVVQQGLYRFVRHPIYGANLLLMLGMTVATGSLLLACNLVVLAVYYTSAAAREERQLAALHPTYTRYCQSTGRFVPRLRRSRA